MHAPTADWRCQGGGGLLAAFLGVAGQFWPFGRQAVHRKLQYGV